MDKSLKVGLILSTIIMVENLVVLWVVEARLVWVGHVFDRNFSENLRFKLYINNRSAKEQRPTTLQKSSSIKPNKPLILIL